jgi:hypothetical protein
VKFIGVELPFNVSVGNSGFKHGSGKIFNGMNVTAG